MSDSIELIASRLDSLHKDVGEIKSSVDKLSDADSVTASASAVRVRLSGGTDGRRYKVTATTTTSSGRIDEADFMVRVDEV